MTLTLTLTLTLTVTVTVNLTVTPPLTRLPLERADVAIVAADEADAFEDDRADDGTGGVELQINDAEALTSTVS